MKSPGFDTISVTVRSLTVHYGDDGDRGDDGVWPPYGNAITSVVLLAVQ